MVDVWGASGRDWLELHLGLAWPLDQEEMIRKDWNLRENWILHCYPDRALLLLIRQYLLGIEPSTESRLRSLIPILARQGSAAQLIIAISLLGLIIVENRGLEPEAESIHLQVTSEMLDDSSLEAVLSSFLQAQVAAFKGNYETADQLYAKLLEVRTESFGASAWVLGRIYEKMGWYLLRFPAHSYEEAWKHTVSDWLRTYTSSPITRRFQYFLGIGMEMGKAPLLAFFPDGPNIALGGIQRETLQLDQEARIVTDFLQAVQSSSQENIQQVYYSARKYGDAFWIDKTKQLYIEMKRPEGRSNPSGFNPAPAPKTDSENQHQAKAYRFTLFGSFQGYGENGEPLFTSGFRRKKVKEMLALLLVQPGYRMVKDILLSTLFGEEETNNAGNYLHVLLHRLRSFLEKASGRRQEWITLADGMVVLNEDYIQGVDVQEYRKKASVGHQLWLNDRDAALEQYSEAIRMYRPIIAPEFEYEDWTAGLRNDLQQNQQQMLRRLRAHAKGKGRIEEAIYYGELLVHTDEWDLSAVRQLCEDIEAAGDQTRIVQICKKYRAQLEEEGEDIPRWMNGYVERGLK